MSPHSPLRRLSTERKNRLLSLAQRQAPDCRAKFTPHRPPPQGGIAQP